MLGGVDVFTGMLITPARGAATLRLGVAGDLTVGGGGLLGGAALANFTSGIPRPANYLITSYSFQNCKLTVIVALSGGSV